MIRNKKKRNAFIVIGALGVGKTTVCSNLDKNHIIPSSMKKAYKHIDLDGYIAKLKKMPVTEYFGKVGYEKFYEESHKIIKRLYNNHIKSKTERILLIDVGSGSTFDYKSIALTKEFQSILLTADPEYLYETRTKCQETHKQLGYYKYWQFGKEKEELYKSCDIKMDVSYLTYHHVSDSLAVKILTYIHKKK